MSLLDKVFNRKIRKHSLEFSCCVIHGERGAGKSTTFALFVDEAKRQGREVYCQFPYDGVHMIPLVAERVKGVTRFDIDKDWLYSHEFEEGAVILIAKKMRLAPIPSNTGTNNKGLPIIVVAQSAKTSQITAIISCSAEKTFAIVT